MAKATLSIGASEVLSIAEAVAPVIRFDNVQGTRIRKADLLCGSIVFFYLLSGRENRYTDCRLTASQEPPSIINGDL
jgi:hypothetical protein